jgi:hypothetical protein
VHKLGCASQQTDAAEKAAADLTARHCRSAAAYRITLQTAG